MKECCLCLKVFEKGTNLNSRRAATENWSIVLDLLSPKPGPNYWETGQACGCCARKLSAAGDLHSLLVNLKARKTNVRRQLFGVDGVPGNETLCTTQAKGRHAQPLSAIENQLHQDLYQSQTPHLGRFGKQSENIALEPKRSSGLCYADHIYTSFGTPVEHSYSSQMPNIQTKKDELQDQPLLKTLGTLLMEGKEKDFAACFQTSQTLDKLIKGKYLSDLNAQLNALAKKSNNEQSLLMSSRDIKQLSQTHNFFEHLFAEIETKCPFLWEMMCCATQQDAQEQVPTALPCRAAIAMAYAILLHQRNNHFSAAQRLTTLIAVKGNADDVLLNRLNKLGVTLHSSCKTKLLDECVQSGKTEMVKAVRSNPKVKITGDNLDMYIRTGSQSSERQNRDLHMFTSNLYTSRIPVNHLSAKRPEFDLKAVVPEDFFLTEADSQLLQKSYTILLGRVVSEEITPFKWMADLLPSHIPHNYSDYMDQQSKVFTLPLLNKNEAKYEECFDILEDYERELTEMFAEAFGEEGSKILDNNKCVVGGDQLTRVRLDGAKRLRIHAPDAEGRYDHVSPIVCEMWHNKVDMTEKAFKNFFDKDGAAEHGSLYYFKVITHQKAVNGNVKSNFKAHWQFLMKVGKLLLCEQVREFFAIRDTNEPFPLGIVGRSKEDQIEVLQQILGSFLHHHNYGKFDLCHNGLPKQQVLPQQEPTYVAVQDCDKVYLVPIKTPAKEDAKFNYANSLCHWVLHLLELDDTAKEGDTQRLVVNCKYNLMFFYSHSLQSKYFVENLDFLLKTEHMLSPQMKLRVLDGSFVNPSGGKGNNVEADLKQEHSVRNRKDLIRKLGANKTEKAMKRATGAADSVSDLAHNIDGQLQLKVSGSRHTYHASEEDSDKIRRELQDTRPFQYTPGRACEGFRLTTSHPGLNIDKTKMRTDMERIIGRLGMGCPTSDDTGETDANERVCETLSDGEDW